MKAKSRKSANAYTYTEDDKKLLNKLNALYKKIGKNSYRYITACEKSKLDRVEIDRLNHESKALSRQFNDLIACLPPVKFNSAAGEYFFKYDAFGDEIFVIQVIETVKYNIAVSASNLKSATAQAEEMVRSGNADPATRVIDTVNMSQSSN